jgi:hypothetical protein
LPKIVVIERLRKSSSTASLTVVMCLSLSHGAGGAQYPGAHRLRPSSVQMVGRIAAAGSMGSAQNNLWRSSSA